MVIFLTILILYLAIGTFIGYNDVANRNWMPSQKIETFWIWVAAWPGVFIVNLIMFFGLIVSEVVQTINYYLKKILH